MVIKLFNIFLYIRNHIISICFYMCMIFLNVYIFLKNIKNKKIKKYEVEQINAFTKAVETVDDMDDDDIVSLLSRVRTKNTRLHNSDKDS